MMSDVRLMCGGRNEKALWYKNKHITWYSRRSSVKKINFECMSFIYKKFLFCQTSESTDTSVNPFSVYNSKVLRELLCYTILLFFCLLLIFIVISEVLKICGIQYFLSLHYMYIAKANGKIQHSSNVPHIC